MAAPADNQPAGEKMGHLYQSILETVGNTPVVRINNLAPAGIDLYVKIEAFNPLGSVKDRLALGVIEAAEKSGELKPGQTVIEATSGNTGIGLAMVCAQKGYPLVVTMAEPFSVERRRLMRFLGAKVVITPAAERGMGMVKKAVELAETHGWFLTRQFENEANPDMHSRTTAREIVEDFAGKRLDYWVTGFGTGGTLKGVARVLAKERPDTKIVVCEPDDAPMLSSGAPQERRRHGRCRAPRLEAAPDAGLEPRFHPEADRRCGRYAGDRPHPAHRECRGDAMQPGSREEGGHLCRHHLGRHFCRSAQGLCRRAARLDRAVHAA
jgi:cysteine synthase A